MKLLTKSIRAALPPLYSTEAQGLDALAQVKFFTPDADWTWYATEFDGDDLFFGLVSGFAVEFSYFRLSELKAIRGALKLPVERDRYFTPTRVGELLELHRR